MLVKSGGSAERTYGESLNCQTSAPPYPHTDHSTNLPPPNPPTATHREAHTMDAELRARADEALQRIVTLRDSL